MNIQFLYTDTIKDLINKEFTYSEPLHFTKGLCYIKKNEFYNIINLGAIQWSYSYELNGIDWLIENITKSIIHENCHGVIRTSEIEGRVTPDGEELVVRLLAEQL